MIFASLILIPSPDLLAWAFDDRRRKTRPEPHGLPPRRERPHVPVGMALREVPTRARDPPRGGPRYAPGQRGRRPEDDRRSPLARLRLGRRDRGPERTARDLPRGVREARRPDLPVPLHARRHRRRPE